MRLFLKATLPSILMLALPLQAGDYTIGGATLHNTHEAMSPGNISTDNVKNLHITGEFVTLPKIAGVVPLGADVTATPAVKDGYLYFPDSMGGLYKVRASDMSLVWKKNGPNDYSTKEDYIEGFQDKTPTIATVNGQEALIIGTKALLPMQLLRCGVTSWAADILRKMGYGPECNMAAASVLAVSTRDGKLLWRTRVNSHPAAHIGDGAAVYKGTVYVVTGNAEESFAKLANGPALLNLKDKKGFFNKLKSYFYPTIKPYQCCSDRGRVVALDLNTGKIKWVTFTTPGIHDNNDLYEYEKNVIINNKELPLNIQQAIDDYVRAQRAAHDPRGLLTKLPGDTDRVFPSPNPARRGFWHGTFFARGNPSIDAKRNRLFVASGQNSMVPELALACERLRAGRGAENIVDPSLFLSKHNYVVNNTTLTCDNLMRLATNMTRAVMALNLSDGSIAWINRPSDFKDASGKINYPGKTLDFDAWTAVCSSNDLNTKNFPTEKTANFASIVPANYENCADVKTRADDQSFGHQPMYLEKLDIVVAAAKDGVLRRLHAADGKQMGETPALFMDQGPGGGFLYGIASDGDTIFLTNNASFNNYRSILEDAVPNTEEMTDVSGFYNQKEYPFGTQESVARPEVFARRAGPQGILTLPPQANTPYIEADVRISYVNHCDELSGKRVSVCKSHQNFKDFNNQNPYKRVVTLVKDYRNGVDPNGRTNPNPTNTTSTPGNQITVFRDLNDNNKIKTTSAVWVAFNALDGNIKWITVYPHIGSPYSSLTLANGVLFSGSTGGTKPFADSARFPAMEAILYGLDAKTGKILFEHIDENANTQANGAPAVVDGKVYWGLGGSWIFASAGAPPGNKMIKLEP